MFEIVKSRHVAQKSDFPVITINKKYVRFNLSCTNLILKELGYIPKFVQLFIDRSTNQIGVHFTEEPVSQSRKLSSVKSKKENNRIASLITYISDDTYATFKDISHRLNAKFEMVDGIRLLIGSKAE